MATFQLSVGCRNARLDAIETFAGTSAKLMIYSGALPANCAAATTGTKLAEFDLASDWAAAATGGSKSFSNTPLSTTAVAGAPTDAGYFRLFESDGTTCVAQGNIAVTGGDAAMTIDNVSIRTGQTVNVTSFSVTDGNA
jgi:hypothetical protein